MSAHVMKKLPDRSIWKEIEKVDHDFLMDFLVP